MSRRSESGLPRRELGEIVALRLSNRSNRSRERRAVANSLKACGGGALRTLWGSAGEDLGPMRGRTGGASWRGAAKMAGKTGLSGWSLRADRGDRSQEEIFEQEAAATPKSLQLMRSQRTPAPEPSPLKRIASWR
jgi:hypothetical protein